VTPQASTLAYLGPQGTYSELAAKVFDPQAKRIAAERFEDIFDLVEQRKCPRGIVPIENLIEGIVRENLELLYTREVFVTAELTLPIVHCIGLRSDPGKITQIASHPQALAQCSHYLRKHFPKVMTLANTSTTAAIELAVRDETVAAIGPRASLEASGLQIIDENIGNNAQNLTRFWVITPQLVVHPEDNKFSLAFFFPQDKPGALYQALGIFAKANINLTSIYNRPTAEKMGNYIFHLDAEGNLDTVEVKSAIEELRAAAAVVKLIGSYRRGEIARV